MTELKGYWFRNKSATEKEKKNQSFFLKSNAGSPVPPPIVAKESVAVDHLSAAFKTAKDMVDLVISLGKPWTDKDFPP